MEAHKLLLLHRPNSLITACDKYMVLSKGTQKAIILIVGKDANTTDVFIFQDNTYNKTFPIDKPGLRVILLTSPVKVGRNCMFIFLCWCLLLVVLFVVLLLLLVMLFVVLLFFVWCCWCCFIVGFFVGGVVSFCLWWCLLWFFWC